MIINTVEVSGMKRLACLWTSVLVVLVAFTGAGCASQGSNAGDGSKTGSQKTAKKVMTREQKEAEAVAKTARIEKILNEPADPDSYTEERDCLPSSRYRNIEIIDEQRIAFFGPGKQIWINQLRNRCPGLRRNKPLRFESRTGRLCAMSRFDIIDFNGASFPCSLGRFSRVSEQQLEGLKMVLQKP